MPRLQLCYIFLPLDFSLCVSAAGNPFVVVVRTVFLFFLFFAFCFCFLPFAFFQFLIKRIFAARQQCEAKKEQEKTNAAAREGKICVQQIIMNKKRKVQGVWDKAQEKIKLFAGRVNLTRKRKKLKMHARDLRLS